MVVQTAVEANRGAVHQKSTCRKHEEAEQVIFCQSEMAQLNKMSFGFGEQPFISYDFQNIAVMGHRRVSAAFS